MTNVDSLVMFYFLDWRKFERLSYPMLNQSFVSKISKYKLSIWYSERSYILWKLWTDNNIRWNEEKEEK